MNLRAALHMVVGKFNKNKVIEEKLKTIKVITEFVKDNATKIRSTDLAFLAGGAKSDAASVRTEVGVSAKLAEEVLQKRQKAQRRRFLC